MATQARTPSSSRRKTISLVMVGNAKLLDWAVLLAAFSEANSLLEPNPPYDLRLISVPANKVREDHDALTREAAMDYRDYAEAPDTLLIVASCADEVVMKPARDFLDRLRWQALHSRRVGAVSCGSFLLGAAGLLNERKATTHWRWQDLLTRHYPAVSLQPDVLYVRDENLYTTAGGMAGLDLALSLMEDDLGSSVASEVAKHILLCFRRTGSAPQISAALRAQSLHSSPIAELLTWLPQNLEQDLTIKTLARRSAMSIRNFARIFQRQVGETPAKHIESLRLEAAKFHLETGTLTVDGVAFATGFDSSETLRRLFVRRLGITPGHYRATKGKSQVSAVRNGWATGN